MIELDYASVMMCELCMHVLVGLDITCIYVMVRGTVCTVYAWEVWHKTVPTSLHMGLGLFVVLY